MARGSCAGMLDARAGATCCMLHCRVCKSSGQLTQPTRHPTCTAPPPWSARPRPRRPARRHHLPARRCCRRHCRRRRRLLSWQPPRQPRGPLPAGPPATPIVNTRIGKRGRRRFCLAERPQQGMAELPVELQVAQNVQGRHAAQQTSAPAAFAAPAPPPAPRRAQLPPPPRLQAQMMWEGAPPFEQDRYMHRLRLRLTRMFQLS